MRYVNKKKCLNWHCVSYPIKWQTNILDHWKITLQKWENNGKFGFGKKHIFFENEEDALLFTMKWK